MKPGPIKILHVVISLGPGGMENGIVNVARALPPGEFEIHVCCLERSGAFAPRLPRPENVHVLHKPPGFSPRAVWHLHRVIRRVRPHIIHSHNLGPLIYCGLLKNLGCRPTLLHGEHHLLAADECTPHRLRQRARFYRSCRQIHTVAENLRHQLIELGLPGSKILTLMNGVDCDRFQPGDRAAARNKIGNLPANAFVVGMVGRFAPFKRQTVLIEAFNRFAAGHPEAHLLLVGGGGSQEPEAIAQARASAAAGRIHFAGFQSDVLPFYQAMNVMVLPSISGEGNCNAVLEAMACGVPVIAHPICGNTEVISHGRDGWLAALDTPEQIKSQLDHLFSRPETLARLGQAGQHKVRERFSLTCMMENYRALYQTLAGHTPL